MSTCHSERRVTTPTDGNDNMTFDLTTAITKRNLTAKHSAQNAKTAQSLS